MNSFDQFAEYYDALYYKEEIYAAESRFIIGLIDKYKLNSNVKILDIACGTGTHLKFFMPRFAVSGLDLSAEMLAVARKRYPGAAFYQADMTDFCLDEQFGAVICLFGSIGFVHTTEALQKTLRSFSLHLAKGGILILTPWSTLQNFQDAVVSDKMESPGLQIVRMEKVSKVNGNMVDITYHYLIGENGDVRYYTGHHFPIRLYSLEEYTAAVRQAGLEIVEEYRGDKVQMGMTLVCRKI
jgi:SAM-dependent methyltransferase